MHGVTNSEGAEAGYSRSEFLLATTAGFAGGYVRTGHSVSATALAGEATGMQRDYDYHSATFLTDLDDPAVIGRSAGERAVARLNPRRPATARVPVVFAPRVASTLLGHLSAAINGASIARGTSFLKDSLGQAVFAPFIRVHDEPRRLRGLRSRPFDSEGVPTANSTLVQDGVLTTWLLDSRSARQLGLRTTGHAGGVSNAYLAAGQHTPAALMADIAEGLYVTELMGMGVNGLTGDYSRGAAGVHDPRRCAGRAGGRDHHCGQFAGDVRTMIPANDLHFRRGLDSPTVRIGSMMMAGA